MLQKPTFAQTLRKSCHCSVTSWLQNASNLLRRRCEFQLQLGSHSGCSNSRSPGSSSMHLVFVCLSVCQNVLQNCPFWVHIDADRSYLDLLRFPNKTACLLCFFMLAEFSTFTVQTDIGAQGHCPKTDDLPGSRPGAKMHHPCCAKHLRALFHPDGTGRPWQTIRIISYHFLVKSLHHSHIGSHWYSLN